LADRLLREIFEQFKNSRLLRESFEQFKNSYLTFLRAVARTFFSGFFFMVFLEGFFFFRGLERVGPT
jgi:hypothetical protein